LGNFGGDGEKYGVEKTKIRCSRGVPPRRRSAPRFLISVRAPALVSPRPLASISRCWSSSRRRSGRCSSSPTTAAIVLFDFCPKLYRPPLRFLPDCRSCLHPTSPVDPPWDKQHNRPATPAQATNLPRSSFFSDSSLCSVVRSVVSETIEKIV
jgi:hypothetical protein